MKIANTLFFVSTIVIGFSSCNSSRTEGDVSVLRDATYLVQYPICSGNQFGNCPKKGDIASSDCNKHLSSWNSTTEMCELTEDTECRDDFGAGIYQCGTPTLTESDRSDISAEDTTTENQMEEDTTTENQTEDDTSSNSDCNSSRTEGDVSVLRDATYLVQYPICSGNQFGNCPKKGDIASSDCNKHLSSWNSTTEMCELTEDTECRDDFGAGIYQCGTPTLKLTYFDIRGRGELIRLILNYGQIKFEDKRISFEEFPELKESFPFGHLPVFYVNGKPIAESMAIARYAAKLSGLTFNDNFKNAQVDMFLYAVVDIFEKFVEIIYLTKNEDDKENKKKKLLEETVPKFFNAFKKMKKGKFLVGNDISIADIALFNVFYVFQQKIQELDNVLVAYPEIKEIVDNVSELPQLKHYLESSTEGTTTENQTPEDATTEGTTTENQTPEDTTTEGTTTGNQTPEDATTEGTTTENQTPEDTTTENQTEDDTSSNSISDSPSSSEDENNSTPSPSSSSNKVTYSSSILVSFLYVFSFGFISFGKNL